MTSNHFKRTSCAPALLAVVARAACGVSLSYLVSVNGSPILSLMFRLRLPGPL